MFRVWGLRGLGFRVWGMGRVWGFLGSGFAVVGFTVWVAVLCGFGLNQKPPSPAKKCDASLK